MHYRILNAFVQCITNISVELFIFKEKYVKYNVEFMLLHILSL